MMNNIGTEIYFTQTVNDDKARVENCVAVAWLTDCSQKRLFCEWRTPT